MRGWLFATGPCSQSKNYKGPNGSLLWALRRRLTQPRGNSAPKYQFNVIQLSSNRKKRAGCRWVVVNSTAHIVLLVVGASFFGRRAAKT
eukprot:scaffold115_cov172-Amphora_coffeaeformis.AAC.4